MEKDLKEALGNLMNASKERNKKLFEKMAENTRRLGDDKFVDPNGSGKGSRYFVTTSQKHWLESWEDDDAGDKNE